MAREREIYNPYTGQWEAVDDYQGEPGAGDGGAPPGAGGWPALPPPPPDPREVDDKDTVYSGNGNNGNGNGNNANNPPVGTRRPSRPGFYEEWDGSKWVEYSDPSYAGNRRDGGGNPYNPAAAGAAPALRFPDYESVGPFVPRNATFTYDPYTPSSWQDAENEPGFKEAQARLRKEIEAGAAYRGVLRSGKTLTDLDTGLGSSRQQNFQAFDSRRFRNWEANVGAAAQKFGLEYGVDRDIFDRRAQDVDRGNNFRFNVSSEQFKDALARWQTQIDSLTRIATAGAQS